MQYIYVPIFAAKEKDVPYKKGDRLLVKVDNAAFLGTITRIANGQIYLLFDDGDKGTVSLKSKRILGIGISRKVKKAIDLQHAQNYLKESNRASAADNKLKKSKKEESPSEESDIKHRTNDNPYNNPKAQIVKPKANFKPKKVSYSSLKERDWYQLKVENEDGDFETSDGVIVYKDKKHVLSLRIDKYGYIVLSPVKSNSTALTLDQAIIYKLSAKISNNLINAYNKYCKIKYGKEKGDEYQALHVATSLARLNMSRTV